MLKKLNKRVANMYVVNVKIIKALLYIFQKEQQLKGLK